MVISTRPTCLPAANLQLQDCCSLTGAISQLRCPAVPSRVCWWAWLPRAERPPLSAGSAWSWQRLASASNLFTRSTMKSICRNSGGCRTAEKDDLTLSNAEQARDKNDLRGARPFFRWFPRPPRILRSSKLKILLQQWPRASPPLHPGYTYGFSQNGKVCPACMGVEGQKGLQGSVLFHPGMSRVEAGWRTKPCHALIFPTRPRARISPACSVAVEYFFFHFYFL